MVAFPLLLIPIAIYNIIAFLMRGVSFDKPVLQLTLMSGDDWPVALRDMLLALSILLLLFEVIKGTRPGAKYLTDHLLSALVFAGAAAEFVLLPRFGTSTFFLLTTLALVEFFSGIALRARRGPHVTSVTSASRTAVRTPVADPPEPHFEPVVHPAVVAPAEVPGSQSRAEPVIVQSGVAAGGPPAEVHPPELHSPEVRSPHLQPGDPAHPSSDTPPR